MGASSLKVDSVFVKDSSTDHMRDDNVEVQLETVQLFMGWNETCALWLVQQRNNNITYGSYKILF